jgi:PAS domain S-box-containing protein
LGYEAEELIGKKPFGLMPPDEAERVATLFEHAARNQKPIESLENTNVHKAGHRVVLETSAVPILDASGSLLGYRGIDRDITQRKFAERQLAKTVIELKQSNADLQQFAYAASHDLQEPLRAIGGFARLMHRHYQGTLDERANEYIGFLVNGVTRMQELINDLLAYSRIGMREKRIELADSNQAVDRAIANLETAIAETGANVHRGQLPTVMADHSQLAQLFQNLIGNAIKFHGDEPPCVRISAKRSGRAWVFSVQDNGIGIAPRHADRIFVVFQRLHHRAKYPGTGIGLAICKRIVECHEGRIWLDSAPKKGATFCFTIPVRE